MKFTNPDDSRPEAQGLPQPEGGVTLQQVREWQKEHWNDSIMKGPIYIAGPMRGIVRYNFDAFYDAEVTLVAGGWTCINPARLDVEEGFDPDDSISKLTRKYLNSVMERDVRLIVEQAAALVLLPGWENSTGAQSERWLAHWKHIPVYLYPTMGLLETPRPDMVYMITGRPRSGKDTLGTYIAKEFGLEHGSLSDVIYEELAGNWGISVDQLRKIPKEIVRPALIELGDSRCEERRDYWIDKQLRSGKRVICGVRRVQEYESVREPKMLIWVDRTEGPQIKDNLEPELENLAALTVRVSEGDFAHLRAVAKQLRSSND